MTREIKAAADLGFQLEAILDKGRDPDRFKAVHAQFVEQVAKAEAKVKEGLVELERRERERAARNEIDSTLQDAISTINDCIKSCSMSVLKHETYERDLGGDSQGLLWIANEGRSLLV